MSEQRPCNFCGSVIAIVETERGTIAISKPIEDALRREVEALKGLIAVTYKAMNDKHLDFEQSCGAMWEYLDYPEGVEFEKIAKGEP